MSLSASDANTIFRIVRQGKTSEALETFAHWLDVYGHVSYAAELRDAMKRASEVPHQPQD
jgi:hypothetical protein